MAFTDATLKILSENPELRRDFAQKLAEYSTKTVKPKKAAERAVKSIEQQEAKILGSDTYRRVFDETVKPEMRPLQPIEDCFDRGYLFEDAFWNDCHNRVAYSYGQNPKMKGLLRRLCEQDGTKALIESRRAEARTIGEAVPREELKINVPIPKAKKKAVAPTTDKKLMKMMAIPEENYGKTLVSKPEQFDMNVMKMMATPEENYGKTLLKRSAEELKELLNK